MDANVCQYCGQQSIADEVYCTKCGRRLGPEPPSSLDVLRPRASVRVLVVTGIDFVRRLVGLVFFLGMIWLWYRVVTLMNWDVVSLVEGNPYGVGLLLLLTAIAYWLSR